MLYRTNNSASQISHWVKNLNKTKQLSSSQQKVLEKNLNFAITPKRIPVIDIVASFEKGFKNVPNQSAVELARSEITQNFELHKITFSKFIARRKESFAGITIESNHQNYESGQRQLYSDNVQEGL